MANNNHHEKELAAQETVERTEWERQRLFSYDKLRYSFSPWSVDEYYNDILRQRSAIYCPKKDPSQWRSRRNAKVGVIQWLKSRFDQEEKKKIWLSL